MKMQSEIKIVVWSSTKQSLSLFLSRNECIIRFYTGIVSNNLSSVWKNEDCSLSQVYERKKLLRFLVSEFVKEKINW